ncbi:hypothetical protein BSKO_02237 [Bryopsis sp. KO-2023]|nr:hypothetical protein BSKO_02237 [Bryopsis sp. KO-2023]
MNKFSTEGGVGTWISATFHPNKHPRIPSRVTAEAVAKDWDGEGKVAVVTGGYSGIGLETARVLALQGCDVVIAGRDVEKGNAAVEGIKKEHRRARVRFSKLDLSSLPSVKSFVDNFGTSRSNLDILVNNAGVGGCPFTLNASGREIQFATNHVGHFLLTNLLLKRLRDTGKRKKRPARVITVSSHAHFRSYREGIRFGKLDSPFGYNRMQSYGQSKLANLLFARSLDERLKARKDPVVSVAVHPGVIFTNLFRHIPGWIVQPLEFVSKYISLPHVLTIPEGAASSVYLATAPDWKLKGGEYYYSCTIQPSSEQSQDRDAGDKLWAISEKLCEGYL